MTRRKSVSIASLALLATFGLTACGGAEEVKKTDSSASATASPTDQPTAASEGAISISSLSTAEAKAIGTLKEVLKKLETVPTWIEQNEPDDSAYGGGTESVENYGLTEDVTVIYSKEPETGFVYKLEAEYVGSKGEKSTAFYDSTKDDFFVHRPADASSLDQSFVKDVETMAKALKEFERLNPGELPSLEEKDGRFFYEKSTFFDEEDKSAGTPVPVEISKQWESSGTGMFGGVLSTSWVNKGGATEEAAFYDSEEGLTYFKSLRVED